MKAFRKIMLPLLIVSLLSPIIVNADTYYENSGEDAGDIFDTTYSDITSPLEWMKNKKTYTLISEDADGNITYWFNTPNYQQILYNKALLFVPHGYIGNGINVEEKSKGGIIKVELPPIEEAKTGLERYGFNIPNPAYVGESPKIDMSLSGVFVERNPLKFVWNKISGIFGGSILSAPSKKNLETLYYAAPNDYSKSGISFVLWMEEYWDDTMEKMEPGQILHGDADSEGMLNGVQYVKDTIITQNNLESGNYNEINKSLQDLLGPEYHEVILNIIAFGVNEVGASSYDKNHERIMPYDLEGLRDIDKMYLKTPDPRTIMHTKFGFSGVEINSGIDRLLLSNIKGSLIDIGGAITEKTVFINSLINFETVDTLGLSPTIFWESPLVYTLIILVAILLVVYLVKSSVQILAGNTSIKHVAIQTLISFMIIGFLFSVHSDPEKYYNITKKVATTMFSLGSSHMALDREVESLYIQGDSTQRSNTAYWLPYYSMWTKYNTGEMIHNGKIDKGNINNEPEQKNLEYPKIANREVLLWSAVGAEALTSGEYINNNIYRMVDHYLAPRIKYNGLDSTPIIESRVNENFNGEFQKIPDIGNLFIIILILVGVFIKFIMFLEFIFELFIFVINLILRSDSLDKIKFAFKELFISMMRITIWDFFLTFMITTSMYTTGAVSLLMSMFIAFIMYQIYQRVIVSRSIWAPKIFRIARTEYNKLRYR